MPGSNDGINRRVNGDIERPVLSSEGPMSAASRENVKSSPSWVAVVVLTTVLSILSSVTSVAVYDRFFAQKVVTANISRFVMDQRELYFQGKIDKEQYINSLTRFIELLKSQPRNRVIILEDVVAANAEKLEPR